MNEREISEIRRRFRPDYSNISQVRGCYVSDKGEILTQFSQSVNLMLEDEKEKILAVLKKVLSGTLGKNLTDIVFPTKQVVDGQEHKLLMKLRDSNLEDGDAVEAFYEKVIQSVHFDTNYLILLTCDAYDVPYRGKDGGGFADGSDQVFRYILCSVCPVKLSKSALSFHRSWASCSRPSTAGPPISTARWPIPAAPLTTTRNSSRPSWAPRPPWRRPSSRRASSPSWAVRWRTIAACRWSRPSMPNSAT